jgi:hypothetical protein
MSETREGMVPFEVLIQVINQMLKTWIIYLISYL